MIKNFIFWTFIIFCMVSCTNSTQTIPEPTPAQPTQSPVPTLTATSPTATLTPTLTPTPRPTHTPAPTPTSIALPKGTYLLYSGFPEKVGQNWKFSIRVVDLDTKSIIEIGVLDYDVVGPTFSFDGLHYAYLSSDFKNLFVVDVISQQRTLVPNQQNCEYESIDAWSPDGESLLMECGDEYTYEIKLIRIADGNLVGVVPAYYERKDLPTVDGKWSPDGKWIAYYDMANGPGDTVGPYIAPTDCLQNTPKCRKKVITLATCIELCRFWWTNDNLLAVDYPPRKYPNQIGFFDPQTGALVRNEDLGGVDNQSDYSWSPDGRYLVIENTRENGARIVKEITSGKMLFDLDAAGCDLFLGWLSIP